MTQTYRVKNIRSHRQSTIIDTLTYENINVKECGLKGHCFLFSLQIKFYIVLKRNTLSRKSITHHHR